MCPYLWRKADFMTSSEYNSLDKLEQDLWVLTGSYVKYEDDTKERGQLIDSIRGVVDVLREYREANEKLDISSEEVCEPAPAVTCKFCGKTNLSWGDIEGYKVLFEDCGSKVHDCGRLPPNVKNIILKKYVKQKKMPIQ